MKTATRAGRRRTRADRRQASPSSYLIFPSLSSSFSKLLTYEIRARATLLICLTQISLMTANIVFDDDNAIVKRTALRL